MNAIDLATKGYPSGAWGVLNYELFDFSIGASEKKTDTSDLIILNAGVLVLDADIWVKTASNADVTVDVGLKSVSGTNQDDTDWAFSGQALSAVAFARRSSSAVPIVLAQDMYLRLTIGGADLSQACAGKIGLAYRYLGGAV